MITGRSYVFSKQGLMQHVAKLLYKRACNRAQKVFFLNKDDIDFFVEKKITAENKVGSAIN